ncbi:MAG TPA: ferritin-like domain-containing protein [Vicinamibacterales bacterium]|nr:ferritin-like domain-containing protein [Vicinamibacterales bacterium]
MNEPGTLYEAFVEQLRDTYDAETQVLKALPKMVKAASSPKLQAAFEAHLRETKGHVERLERVFGSLEEEVRGKHCSGMAGILKEGSAVMSNGFDERTIDACLIAAGQHVEHYEMASYGTLVAWSHVVGNQHVSELLQETLLEEKATDLKLSALAEAGINEEAALSAPSPAPKTPSKRVRAVKPPARQH